jgi:hypothetical protein
MLAPRPTQLLSVKMGMNLKVYFTKMTGNSGIFQFNRYFLGKKMGREYSLP